MPALMVGYLAQNSIVFRYWVLPKRKGPNFWCENWKNGAFTLVPSENQTCPEMQVYETHYLYDEHHKVSSFPKSHQNTHNRPFAATFHKIMGYSLTDAEMEKASREYQNGQI